MATNFERTKKEHTSFHRYRISIILFTKRESFRWGVSIMIILLFMLRSIYISLNTDQKFNITTITSATHTSMLDNINHKYQQQMSRPPEISLEQLCGQWGNLLYFEYIKPTLIEPLIKISTYNHYTESIRDFKIILSSQLVDTVYYLAWYLSKNIHIIPSSKIISDYKMMISIRRAFMIIINQTDTTKITNEMYIDIEHITHLLMEIHQIYITAKHQQSPKYFNIHVSKSAGTSVCQTATKILHYKTHRKGHNCNLIGFGTPFKRKEAPKQTCQEIDNMTSMLGFEFFARERPLTPAHNAHIADLCDQFIYILVFREPLLRIASLVSELNRDHYYPFQILIKYGQNYDDKQAKQLKQELQSKYNLCDGKIIDIEDNKTKTHYIYTPLQTAKDFSTFVSDIFGAERVKYETRISHKDKGADCYAWKSLKRKKARPRLGKQWYDHDPVYMQWFGDIYSKYAIKVSRTYRNQMNISLVRGYMSNIYTRFLGYKHRNDIESLDGLFVKSMDVDITDMLNTIVIMLRIEHILPFENTFDHDIWKYTLHSLKKTNGESQKWLKWYKTAGSGSNWRDSISSRDIMKYWNDSDKNKEIKILNEKNMIDMKLFLLAKTIADVDVQFYSGFHD